MKLLNFAYQTKKHPAAPRIWMKHTYYMLYALIGVCSMITAYEMITWYVTARKVQAASASAHSYHTLLEKKQQLAAVRHHYDSVELRNTTHKEHHAITQQLVMHLIEQATQQNCQLQSISLNKARIAVQCTCATSSAALTFFAQLEQIPNTTEWHIQSFDARNENIVCSFEGMMALS